MKRFGKQLCLLAALNMVLGIHRGYIALWTAKTELPQQIYPYKAALLPPDEQANLAAGIPVQDAEHLKSLLTDYLS